METLAQRRCTKQAPARILATTSTSPNEQRDHLANVRTLLSWVRTAVTIMAFGFVVAKFGILLRELPRGHSHLAGFRFSTVIGTVLVVAGGVVLILSTLEFLAVRRAIEKQQVRFRPELYIGLSAGLVAIAIVLAVYLLVTGS